MSALASTAGIILAKDLFKKLTTDIYNLVRERTGKAIKQFETNTQIANIYRRIDNIRMVKTIWQIDKPVNLTDFYCSSHVILDKKRKKIVKIDDLGNENHILIQGIAGQGKSIFLRYLCSIELIDSKRIPLFLELRRISKEFSIMDRIFKTFESLGITINDDIFQVLAESGKVLLLLDAFDEIPEDLKALVLTDIEDLAQKYEKLKIIVTSRPHE